MTTPVRSYLRTVLTVVLGLVLVGGACGGDPPPPKPRALPTDLVPATLPDPTDAANPFTLVEFAPARERFADAGARSLVDAGALWEVRRGANLVGTVQVGMLARRVDLASDRDRRELVNAVLPGTASTVKVKGVPVVRAASDDKVTYLVLGDGLFELVEIKVSDKVEPDRIVGDLIAAQLPTGHLELAGQRRRRPL